MYFSRYRTGECTSWKTVAYGDKHSAQKAVCEMEFDEDMDSLTATLMSEAAMVLLFPRLLRWAISLWRR